MSLPFRFVNHSPKHFFPHDVEYPCDDSVQFKDGFPFPFADDDLQAVQGRQLMRKEM